jgi:hypothetical protein
MPRGPFAELLSNWRPLAFFGSAGYRSVVPPPAHGGQASRATAAIQLPRSANFVAPLAEICGNVRTAVGHDSCYCGYATLSIVLQWSRRWWLGALCAVAVGCLSPTLPLPPPAEPDVAGPNEQGLVTLSGTVDQPESTVLALNQRTAHIDGTFADQSGRYTFQMGAQPGDPVELWWEFGKEKSDRLVFRIPYPAPALPTVSGPDAQGLVVLTGKLAPAGVSVYVSDQRTRAASSTVADSSGAYQLVISAAVGDSLELWYLGAAGESKHLTLVVVAA